MYYDYVLIADILKCRPKRILASYELRIRWLSIGKKFVCIVVDVGLLGSELHKLGVVYLWV